MRCECNSGCFSTLLSQEVGSAYYYVRLVADNIEALMALAAQLDASAEVINIVRGDTAVIAGGAITADTDNTFIAVSPEVGDTDDLTTIDGDPNGRVIVVRPSDPAQTLTLKNITSHPIAAIDPFLNQFTCIGHGLVLGQLIGLSGATLPADLVPGAYYAVPVDADTFKVAATKADALANTVVDIVNAGTGFLDIGNLAIDGDMKLTGNESAMLVKDGANFILMGASGAVPAVAPMSGVLGSLAELVLAGNAGKWIQINAAGDGFEIIDYGYDQLQADLLAISQGGSAGDIQIAGIPGLQEALDSKVDDTELQNYYTKTEIDQMGGPGGGGTPLSANLSNLDAAGNQDNHLPVQMGLDQWELIPISDFARGLLAAPDADAADAILGGAPAGGGGTGGSVVEDDLSQTGYTVLDTGLIMQWGIIEIPANSAQIVQYPKQCTLWSVATGSGGDADTNGAGGALRVVECNTSGFTCVNSAATPLNFFWHAYGK